MRKLMLVPLMAVMVTLLSGCWWGPHGPHGRHGGHDRGYDRGGYDRGDHGGHGHGHGHGRGGRGR